MGEPPPQLLRAAVAAYQPQRQATTPRDLNFESANTHPRIDADPRPISEIPDEEAPASACGGQYRFYDAGLIPDDGSGGVPVFTVSAPPR